jgi:hypothetical protein
MSALVASVIGSVAVGAYNAYEQRQASDRAVEAQTNAANSANATQRYMYEQQRADQEPWRQAGMGALTQMQSGDIMQNIQNDPGYKFRLNEGLKGVSGSAAARGMTNSGANMKALTRYGQNYASGEYQNAYNRLSQMAGFGTNANSQNANAGQNYANQYGSNMAAIGNANAAGNMASANALASGLGNAANTYMNYQMMDKYFGKGTEPVAGNGG